MMRIAMAVGVMLVCWSAVTGAQNRQDMQIQADLRQLTELVSRLQLTVNQLSEQIKTVNGRVDQAAEANVKTFANQQLSINQLSSALTTLRENLQDNTVRVSQLTQEFGAVRTGLRLLTDQLNSLVSLLQPPAPAVPVDPVTGAPAPGVPPTTSSAAAPLAPVNLPSSPGNLHTRAMADYTAGRYDIAIEGFQELIEKFPDAHDAAEAQLRIGESYYYKSQCQQALPALQKVLTNYRTSDQVPDALLLLAVCSTDLNRRADAIRFYEQLVKQYPDTAQAIQARQRLDSLQQRR